MQMFHRHTGTHINYYDKKNGVSGTITIAGEGRK